MCYPRRYAEHEETGEWKIAQRSMHTGTDAALVCMGYLIFKTELFFFIVRVEEALDTPRSRTTDPLSPLSFAPGIDKPLLLPR